MGDLWAVPVDKNPGTTLSQVMLLSDLQVGHVTPSFDYNVFIKRAKQCFSDMVEVGRFRRKSNPIDELVIILNGDLVQGENIGEQVSLDELQGPVFDQAFSVVVPTLASYIESAAQYYPKVRVHGVRGNHGRMSKLNALRSNWDNVIMAALAERFTKHKKVTCEFEYNLFYQMVTVKGFRFFVTHGDGIRSYGGTPYGGVVRDVTAWQAALGPFYAALVGHWHSYAHIEAHTTPIIMNGSFVSHDLWVLKQLKKATIPTQTTFGVHSRYGIVWPEKLFLDKTLIPGVRGAR